MRDDSLTKTGRAILFSITEKALEMIRELFGCPPSIRLLVQAD